MGLPHKVVEHSGTVFTSTGGTDPHNGSLVVITPHNYTLITNMAFMSYALLTRT